MLRRSREKNFFSKKIAFIVSEEQNIQFSFIHCKFVCSICEDFSSNLLLIPRVTVLPSDASIAITIVAILNHPILLDCSKMGKERGNNFKHLSTGTEQLKDQQNRTTKPTSIFSSDILAANDFFLFLMTPCFIIRCAEATIQAHHLVTQGTAVYATDHHQISLIHWMRSFYQSLLPTPPI